MTRCTDDIRQSRAHARARRLAANYQNACKRYNPAEYDGSGEGDELNDVR